LAASPPNDCVPRLGRLWPSTWRKSRWPTFSIVLAPRIWIGAALSAARVPVVRVPVTMMSVAVASGGAPGSAIGAGAACGAAWARPGSANTIAEVANKTVFMDFPRI
jgi:hypothetical protein